MAYRNVQDLSRAIVANGGATISIDLEDEPTAGYMVSEAGTEQRYSLDYFKRHGARRLLEFMARNYDTLASGNRYLGAWIAPDNEGQETVYLDVSRNVPVLEEALALGKRHRQLAIWDVKRQREIVL